MANRRRIDVDIVANDNASSVFSRVRSNASSMASSLMNTLGGAANAVGNVDSALRSYNASMYRFNRVVGSVVRTAGDSIYNFTKDAINNFSALEQQHAKTMGAMATEYGKTAEAQQKFLNDSEKLKQQALRLGTVGPNGNGSLNTVYDVSYAQTALIKSGMSADDILKSDAVESILKFAGGNDLDIDTATTFAVNLATVFDKPVEEWGKMLDMVTKAADISVIDVEDIMDSLTYTGGIASGLGRDLEEVLGIISVMGQAGLRGRVAGTGLQAFFTRILSAGELGDTAIGNAPSEYVGNMYNAFIAEAVNADGSFKDMDEVASLLDTAMSELNDQEQAWFAKKLFGLYQMKAAYAITGSVDGDENLIADFIDQITNQSEGTNDIKYELMQGSQYGKIQSLKNAWEGVKTDFGDRLSPVVSAVSDELLNFLNDPQNYEIDWSNLRNAISESGDLIGEKYGEELGRVIEDIGNFGIDAIQIGNALTPQVSGFVGGIVKLLQGDISGALDEFSQGLEDTNENIADLPPELQGSAEAARNVITAFTTLSGINLGTQIIQILTSALNTFIAKPISWVTGKITSTTTSVSSTNSNISANYATINTSTTSVQASTATSVNIGQVPLMNVTATVVNVFGGGSGSNPTNPTTPTTPQLPSGPTTPALPPASTPTGGTPLLPGLTTGIVVGGGAYTTFKGLQGMLSGTTGSQLLLPGATSTVNPNFVNSNWAKFGASSAILNADGTVATRFWNIGGKYMTGYEIAASAGKMLGLAGITAMMMSIPSSGVDVGTQYKNLLTEGMEQGYDNDGLRQYLLDNWNSNFNDPTLVQNEKDFVGKTFDAQTEMYGKWLTTDGAMDALNAIKAELEANGKLSEDFLKGLVTHTGSTGGTYVGNQADLEFLFKILFNKTYDRPWLYAGGFADEYSTEFVQDALNTGAVYDPTAISNVSSNTDEIITQLNNISNNMQSPTIYVDVNTSVDKSGEVDTQVNVNAPSYRIFKDLQIRASQYGATNMDK